MKMGLAATGGAVGMATGQLQVLASLLSVQGAAQRQLVVRLKPSAGRQLWVLS